MPLLFLDEVGPQIAEWATKNQRLVLGTAVAISLGYVRLCPSLHPVGGVFVFC
jgi:hypothetical protein